jgi:uncharacterized protein YraI
MGKLAMSLAFVVASTGAALAQDAVQVNASTLNVRTGPGTGYSVIGTVSSGQSYVRIASSGSWRKIWFDHRAGWVHSSYLTSSGAAERRVTASSLNVRSGPGTGYADVGDAPQNSWWAVVGSSGEWRRIYYRGAARWVHGAYLSSSGGGSTPGGGLPSSSVGFVQLPGSGSGYYAYSTPGRRWGRPAMVYGLISCGSTWNNAHNWARMGIGDISLQWGGPISGHASHQVGKDADVRPVSNGSYEGPLTRWSSSYSSYRTKDLITDHVKPAMSVQVIFYNDPNISSLSYVSYWANHDNHFHIRIY